VGAVSRSPGLAGVEAYVGITAGSRPTTPTLDATEMALAEEFGACWRTADRVALIDWDESHVDVPDLDLVLPHNAAGLDDGAHDIAAQASAAWEAAVCWDDEYAVKRLAEVRAV